MGQYGLFLCLWNDVNEIESSSQEEVAKRLEDVLKQVKLIRSESDIPKNLTKKIAQDIISMSETEPCGLKGCLLYITLQDNNACQMLGSLKLGDQTIVPTFEMYLYLQRRHCDWFKLVATRLFKNLFRDLYTLNDNYELSKRKLFRNLWATDASGG